MLISLGAGAFLPPEVIPYFGLIPLALGLWAAWQGWRGDEDDDDLVVGQIEEDPEPDDEGRAHEGPGDVRQRAGSRIRRAP